MQKTCGRNMHPLAGAYEDPQLHWLAGVKTKRSPGWEMLRFPNHLCDMWIAYRRWRNAYWADVNDFLERDFPLFSNVLIVWFPTSQFYWFDVVAISTFYKDNWTHICVNGRTTWIKEFLGNLEVRNKDYTFSALWFPEAMEIVISSVCKS